jgi:hypothetical protein
VYITTARRETLLSVVILISFAPAMAYGPIQYDASCSTRVTRMSPRICGTVEMTYSSTYVTKCVIIQRRLIAATAFVQIQSVSISILSFSIASFNVFWGRIGANLTIHSAISSAKSRNTDPNFTCPGNGFFPLSPTACSTTFYNCVGGIAYVEVIRSLVGN